MRPFRNSLTLAVAAFALLNPSDAAADVAPAMTHAYFPLAVGNTWTYRCSVEGERRRGKVLQIKEQVTRGPVQTFRAELKVGTDPKPLVQYFSVGADGSLRRSLAPDQAGDVFLAADASSGARHGTWTSAGVEAMRLPALRNVQVLRIENFSADAQDVPAEKRSEWRARYYAKGIGPVAEADGLGGLCELVSYRLAKPPVSR